MIHGYVSLLKGIPIICWFNIAMENDPVIVHLHFKSGDFQ